MHKKKVLIITPIFFGSGTGAATYYSLLADSLLFCGFEPIIISEKADYSKDSQKYQYFGVFPIRTGKNKNIFKDIFVYGLQNLGYLRIPSIISQVRPDIIIIHTSFYNLPGIFPWMVKFVSKLSKNRCFIADVRDVLFPIHQGHHLQDFDKVIVCSKNVFDLIQLCNIDRNRIHHICIPQEKLQINFSYQEKLLSNLGLNSKIYIFYSGMLKELKAVDLLLQAFVEFIYPKNYNIVLVLAGYLKTSNSYILQHLDSNNVLYIGNRSRKDIIHLMAGAKVCVNLSPNESISRSSLEALALSRPVLLPPNIPEYQKECPEFVVSTRSPQEIAKKILQLVHTGEVATYPVDQHLPERVIRDYLEVLQTASV